MNILVLAMGGSGTRLGENIPKQYIELNRIPIFGYILEKYNSINYIDKIIIVSNKNWLDYVKKFVQKIKADKVIDVVPGGINRSSSIKNGLEASKNVASDDDIILFHDATHPYVDEVNTLKVIEAAKECGAATLVSYNYDTVYSINDGIIQEVVPRQNIVVGASPECFKFRKIYDIYDNASLDELEKMTSAGAIALAYGMKMKTIESDYLNLKITYKKDLELLKKLLNTYFFENFDYEKYELIENQGRKL